MFKRIVSFLLVALMLLSLAACGNKKEELIPNGDAVVAKVCGHDITKQQLYVSMAAYVGQYNMTMAEIANEPELREKLVNDFITDAVMDYALAENADRYGYEYTAEEQAAFDASYEEFLVQLDATNKEDFLAEAGNTEEAFEEKRLSLRNDYFDIMGYTPEEYKENQRCTYISGKIQDLISASVTVDADAVHAYYDNLLAAGNTSMPVTYTFSLANTEIKLYAENGYRYVKPLLLEFPAASVLTNVEYYSAGETAKLDASIARDVGYMQDTIDEIRAKLASGVDFDDLVAQYGQDTSMTVEPYKSRGYIQITGDANAIPSYGDACDSLTDTEMVTECTTYKGFWFLQASEIVDKGPIPFEEVKAAMTNELTAMKKNLQYDETTTALMAELKESGDIKIDLDKFYD